LNPATSTASAKWTAIVQGFEASCKGLPVGPLEVDVASALHPAQALGQLLSATGGDLTLTFGANSVVLKGAFLAENDGFAWSRKNNRLGELDVADAWCRSPRAHRPPVPLSS
jgi:hypothetical protein